MKKLIERFSSLVKGSIINFDHIFFKGFIRSLIPDEQVIRFCKSKMVLNKDYKSWMMT